MKFKIDGKSILFRNGREHKFHDEIREAVEFEDLVAVRLEGDASFRNNQNVYALDYHGVLLWQIPYRTHSNEHSPYVGVYRKSDTLDALNYDGLILTLDPRTGTIQSEAFVSVAESRHRRIRTERRWL